MPTVTRRGFVQSAAAVAAATAVLPSPMARANPLGLPLGLQLYSVREQLQKDYAGTLKQVSGAGYREVEAAGFYNHSPADVKAAMTGAGLHCVSAHYPSIQLQEKLDAILEFHKQLGTAKYIICAFPGFRDAGKAAGMPHKQQVSSFTLDDWKWNAEQFNTWGKKVQAAGFQFGYHNHTMEFVPQGGVVPYDLLLQETDPKLVIMELDCGWVTVGGGSPEHYLRTYPNRIKMLHVKDFAKDAGHSSIANPPPAAELGRGTADYHAIFAAVKPGAIQHMFVEQEAYPDLPWLEALKVDADYMKTLKA
jgi:sugar phosphate isomerase/epimerase